MDEIKRIKPETELAETSSDTAATQPSVVIPKISPGAQSEETNQVGTPENSSVAKEQDVENRLKNLGIKRWNLSPRNKKILKGVGIFFLILFLLIFVPSIFIFQRGRVFARSASGLVEAGRAKDVALIKSELGETKVALAKFGSSFRLIAWTKYIPFFGRYTDDGLHLVNAGSHGLDALELLVEVGAPYADILGFTNNVLGEEATSGEETAKDRIDFIANSLPDLLPHVDELSTKATLVKTELDEINPRHYPETFFGSEVRGKIVGLQEAATLSEKFLVDGRPLLEQAPYLLGLTGERNFLVLFQNDKELRPTGGFMTAYSIMKVDKARFEPVISNDIYDLDLKYNPSIQAPDPIVRYLKGPYILDESIRLRDMNWSPDFEEAMDLFTEEAQGIGIDDVDGIIAVDTQLLVNLLDAIGPIGVSGFGNFSTEEDPECRCPQVIYELESFADVEGPIVWDPVSGEIVYRPPNSDNRKRIIGPLMNSILANSLAQPKEKIPSLFEAVYKSLIEKHVLFYMLDDGAQAAVESFGIAGKIDTYEGDYLHINDANLGGRKSNLYVTQEVLQDIEVAQDGSVTKTLTITYNNPEPHDGWLNSVLPNWVRIYVPKGSELIDVSGLEDREDPYEEFGKTVFAGFFELRPQGVAKVTLTYKLPFLVKDEYKVFLQKQSGKDIPLYTLNVGNNLEEFYLNVDQELKLPI